MLREDRLSFDSQGLAPSVTLGPHGPSLPNATSALNFHEGLTQERVVECCIPLGPKCRYTLFGHENRSGKLCSLCFSRRQSFSRLSSTFHMHRFRNVKCTELEKKSFLIPFSAITYLSLLGWPDGIESSKVNASQQMAKALVAYSHFFRRL